MCFEDYVCGECLEFFWELVEDIGDFGRAGDIEVTEL